MTDQQLALQAMSDAQHILEEFLQPRPHNDKRLLERLVEVLERPAVVVAVDRLQPCQWRTEKTRRVESAGLLKFSR